MQFSDLDLSKTYSYADYLQWTFEERLELIRGKVFQMRHAPSAIHQHLSWIISGELYGFLKYKPGRVYTAPFDVRLPRIEKSGDNKIFTVVQPDISIICDPEKVDDRGCTGAPDIVVEILSPGNNRKELQNKYEAYEESGVKEYWIISPQDETFLKYTLVDSKYQPSKLMITGAIITTEILPGFELALDTLFSAE